MLRVRLNAAPCDSQKTKDRCWRVSSGTAAVLGLRNLRMDTAPTTAYLMLGDRCSRDCSFCAQARGSQAQSNALSRVTWPKFPATDVAEAVTCAYQGGNIVRACFQVTVSPGHLKVTKRCVSELATRSQIPICASVAPRDVEDVAALLAAGAERVTIALDAACERVYRANKGGAWAKTLALLETCAGLYPGHIGTHLIVGLGETEREMVECIQRVVNLGIANGLFAFTPVKGTALAGRQPPPLGQYRRMQVARWLIVNDLAQAGEFTYGDVDGLISYGPITEQLDVVLAGGDAFRTSGCPGCNRPYYNERPGGAMYNYPRPLTPEEAEREIRTLMGGLVRETVASAGHN